MKKALFCAFAIITFSMMADEILYSDNFTHSTWKNINTAKFANVDNNTLILPDSQMYIHYVSGVCPFGAKICFSIEKTDASPYQLGFIIYPEEKGKKMQRLMSTEQNGSGKITVEIPERASSIALIIQGTGHYRKAQAVRLVDPSYRLEADPSYQIVSDQPKKPVFKLFHKEKEIAGATIQDDGFDAFHPESGATVHAFVDKGDPAPFDAIAKDIKIEKPVSILYLGDSLTHFDIGRNHVDKTGYFLNKYNPGKVKVWNYACGGDNIQRVIQRLNGNASVYKRDYYHDLWSRNYDWAIIFLGHNDTKASSAKNYQEPVIPPAKQKELYRQLIVELRNKGIQRIILFSTTSSNFDVCRENAEKLKRVHNRFGDPVHLENFNRILQELAIENQLEYMDLYTEMKAMTDKAILTRPQDGVHLTDRGHDYVALKTLQYLKKVEKQ